MDEKANSEHDFAVDLELNENVNDVINRKLRSYSTVKLSGRT